MNNHGVSDGDEAWRLILSRYPFSSWQTTKPWSSLGTFTRNPLVLVFPVDCYLSNWRSKPRTQSAASKTYGRWCMGRGKTRVHPASDSSQGGGLSKIQDAVSVVCCCEMSRGRWSEPRYPTRRCPSSFSSLTAPTIHHPRMFSLSAGALYRGCITYEGSDRLHRI